MNLSVGENVVKVEVAAQDGVATETYLVTVTRAALDTSLSPPASDPAASASSAALYSITFHGTWTTDVTPGGLPGSAHFSRLIGGVHNAGVIFLESGGTAGSGVESMAETGEPSNLLGEVQAAINATPPTALGVLEGSTSFIGPTAGRTLSDVTLTSRYPRVTLTTMIAPSHDWFVGVSGMSLLDSQGRRLASREVDPFPWDAGTEDGDDFSLSPSVATNPQGVIASGTGSFSAKPIATLTFTRQSLPPSFPATESGARAVPENTAAGVDFGEPFVATDPDSGDSLSYSLGSPDAASFAIDASTGQMRTEATLDHETRSEYSVTVIATDSSGLAAEVAVTITVTNVDEDGTVTLFPTQPRVGTVLTARVDDPDGGVVDEYGRPVEWQWAWSSDKVNWTAIPNMPNIWVGVDYAPDSSHEGMYLRVTATYTDAQGSGKTAEVVSDHPVGEPAPAPELSVRELVSGLSHPWDIAFTPDGTMLFTERPGVLSSRLTDGTIQTVTADFSDLWVSVKTGLMGIVTDPDFASNRRFYTCQGHWDVAVQVVSWTIDDGYTTATRVDDPLVYWEISNFGAGLAGCRVRFGPQGYLWISTGDGGVQTNAQDLGSLAGKILRVDASTGAGAPTNPFAPSPVYTYGHRNPQGLALRPGTNQMWSVEHGPHWDDEINLLVAGGNYGWDPASSGLDGPMTDLERYPDAIEAKWSSGNPTPATSDGAFLEGEDWGEWEGRLAVATLKMKSLRIFEFTQEGDFVSHVISPEPNWVWGRLRSPVMGPDGALYVTTDRSDLGLGRDRILRVTASRAPAFMTDTQVRDAEENNSPLSIVAKVLALDPKGATLTYTLSGPDAASFNIPDPTVGELRANVALDYETRRSYEVIVTATNPDGLSDSVTLTINVTDVNEADQSPPSGGGDAGGGGSSGGGGGGSSGGSSSGGSSGGGGGGGANGGGEPPRASELFDDVVAGAWYESAVSWMILHQVTAGCTPTMFCPEGNLTRQQFVTFLWRAAGRPTPTYRGSEAFTDVPDGVYADQAIGWAVSNGTTLGCTEGSFGDPDWRFCPTQDVTRGQMATLLYRHVQADHQGGTPPYTDVAPERFYTPAIAWLTDFQVVPGCEPQLFCPHRPATRAEGALFISGVAIRLDIWGPGNTAFIFNEVPTAQ